MLQLRVQLIGNKKSYKEQTELISDKIKKLFGFSLIDLETKYDLIQIVDSFIANLPESENKFEAIKEILTKIRQIAVFEEQISSAEML